MAAAIILALTVFISLAGLWVAPRIIEWNLFRPYWFLRLRQYWTAIGSAFVHANLSHLLFNCLTFWFFAFPLERDPGGAVRLDRLFSAPIDHAAADSAADPGAHLCRGLSAL
jgi:membrane associated rhomboid family serine protease